MSASDDKLQEGAVDQAGSAAEAASGRHEKNKQDTNAGGIVILFFIIGFAASMIVGWIIFPKLLYSQKDQPFNFSHAIHNQEVDNGCESCHFFREDGTFAGIPRLEQCIECHEEVQGESADEKRFVEAYVNKEREVPWLVYSRQPDCVFFSHAAHVKKGDMECKTCHGPIENSEQLKPYQENRITGVSRDIWGYNIGGFKKNIWDRMKMGDCAKCHKKELGVKDACFVCHK